MPSLRDLLVGDFGGGIGPGGGAISAFEPFGRRPEGPAGGGNMNPFAGLQQATAPMATAGMQSQNGAPTTTAPAGGGGGGGGGGSALSTGAPIGTMAHAGGGGPFTFGFPFGMEDNEATQEAGGAGESDSSGGGAGGDAGGGEGDDEGGDAGGGEGDDEGGEGGES